MLLYVDVNIDLVFCSLGFWSSLCSGFRLCFIELLINTILHDSSEISVMTTLVLSSILCLSAPPHPSPPSFLKQISDLM